MVKVETNHPQSPELEHYRHAIEELFISRRDCYPLQHQGQRLWKTVKEPLTDEAIEAHLIGQHTIGAYALNKHSRAKFVALDADSDEAWEQLRAAAAAMTFDSICCHLEQSRKGGHLWLFLDKQIDGAKAHSIGHMLVDHYSITESIEIFPKQKKLTQGGVGSFVRIPFGIHQATGKRYPMISLQGEPIAPTIREQISLVATAERASAELLISLIPEIQPLPQASAKLPLPKRVYSADLSKPPSILLKRYIPIRWVASQDTNLNSKGYGKCPFHEDSNPSFNAQDNRPGEVSAENYWHCYSCGRGGSVIDYYMFKHNIPFKEAIRRMMQEYADLLPRPS